VPPLECLRELHFGRILSVVEQKQKFAFFSIHLSSFHHRRNLPFRLRQLRLLRQDFS
jgi:hypothetical protein